MGSPYYGEIRMFAGNFAPAGWMFCEGQSLPISEYDVLFNLIGTTYGGDGQSTFNLPDLRGRIPIHVGTGFVQGQLSGTETVTLTVAQLPSHTHQAVAATGGTPATVATNNSWGPVTISSPYSSSPTDSTMSPATVGTAGNNQPHENFMPYLCVNFIIAMFGFFPSQS